MKIVVGKWKGQKQMKMKQYKKNDSCDFFPNQVFMEKEHLIETMGNNRSLETQ